MMSIVFASGKVLVRHTGDHLPDFLPPSEGILNEQIVSIQVDGDEKEAVNAVFPMLCPWHVRVAVFTQPFAELIYRNLRNSTMFTA